MDALYIRTQSVLRLVVATPVAHPSFRCLKSLHGNLLVAMIISERATGNTPVMNFLTSNKKEKEKKIKLHKGQVLQSVVNKLRACRSGSAQPNENSGHSL